MQYHLRTEPMTLTPIKVYYIFTENRAFAIVFKTALAATDGQKRQLNVVEYCICLRPADLFFALPVVFSGREGLRGPGGHRHSI